MSYCFNPACQNPQNPDGTPVCSGCGANLLLADRYRALKLLGSGGFGRTFLAVDEYKPSQPLCAIKQIFQQGPDVSSTKRFYTEAVQLEQLGVHGQIPHLLAYFTQDERHYLVQEFIDGQNLAQELESQGAFSEVKIRQLLSELLPVLEFIHDRQVIHRDIKPENIIRRNRRSGELTLVDFGAAKVAPPGQRTGTVIGSAAYTAPEQLLGKAVAASDIYSLGVTCIHLLTMIPPFDLYDSTEGRWVWRDFLRTPITRSLGQILDKMLCNALKHRYSSAASILADLNPTVPSTAVPLPPLVAPPPPPLPPLVLASKVPKPQPQNPKVLPLQPEKRKAKKIEEALQASLTKYWVKVKLTWGKKYLKIVLQREKGTPINYSYLGKEILKTIGELSLPEAVETIKVFGQVQRVTEWKHDYQVKPEKSLFKSARVKLAEYQTQRFWLTQLQDRKFWLDVLTFAMLSFVLNFRMVLLNPIVATMAAGGFMVVKNWMRRDRNFQEEKLVKAVMLGCIIIGFVHVKWSISGGFGMLLACLLMGLPLFYVRS
ncbi:MAG: protein kinase [Hormoscilla sp.]